VYLFQHKKKNKSSQKQLIYTAMGSIACRSGRSIRYPKGQTSGKKASNRRDSGSKGHRSNAIYTVHLLVINFMSPVPFTSMVSAVERNGVHPSKAWRFRRILVLANIYRAGVVRQPPAVLLRRGV
jgi:hypothetical protein